MDSGPARLNLRPLRLAQRIPPTRSRRGRLYLGKMMPKPDGRKRNEFSQATVDAIREILGLAPLYGPDVRSNYHDVQTLSMKRLTLPGSVAQGVDRR